MSEDQSDKAARPVKPRVVVGLDFGTTHSGHAYAHVSDPDRIITFYNYPQFVGEKPYGKTLTVCYYKPLAVVGADPKVRWKLQSWGYPARTDYERDMQALDNDDESQEPRIPSAGSSITPHIPQAPSVGEFLSRFKLHFASRNTSIFCDSAPTRPTLGQVITDYYRELGKLILMHLLNTYGTHFTSEMIQWCIRVPSIRNDSSKAITKTCMAATGLVSAHHPVIIVLEPEAASFHCQRLMGKVVLEPGNKFLIVDMDDLTSDIVVLVVLKPGCRMKEVTMSSGGFCGSTYMDSRFMKFLEGKVGQACVADCIRKHSNVYDNLMKEWECIKLFFDCDQGITIIDLPPKLAAEWERSDMESGHPGSESMTT